MVSRSILHAFWTTLFVFSITSASPTIRIRDSPVTLPISAQVSVNGDGAQGLIARDLKRAQFLAAGGRSGSGPASSDNTPVGNDAIFSVIEVEVSTPPKKYQLILDTASANTWVGARQRYTPGNSTGKTSESFLVNYGSGSAGGTQYLDTFSLGDNLGINQQSIGDADWSKGFNEFQVDGVLGVGPTDLTVGKLIPSRDSPVPTVMDNLSGDGKISSASLGIFLTPYGASTAQLSWGQPDCPKCTSPLATVDVSSSWPASAFWGVNQELKYGDQTILASSQAIIDSGTTLIYISSDAFQNYQKATGATMNNKVGLLELPAAEYGSLKSLFFNMDGTTVELTSNGQIWPRSLNTNIGGDKDKIYLIVRPLDGLSGISVVNGFVWMQRFYIYLDYGKRQIGFANTEYTHKEIN